MLETLRAWLNGSRNYFTGVAIYQQLGTDKDLLNVLQKGPNEFRVKRLNSELLTILESSKLIAPSKSIPKEKKADTPPLNEDLYLACKKEADLVYKEAMNKRAVLFSLATTDDYKEPNSPDKIKSREKLAIEVVVKYQKASDLYDRAKYVKDNGRLPNTEEILTTEFTNLPNHLVKLQLDNARKAYNKLKAKEETPARIVLMQRHVENIKNLEEKWHSLQPR